MIIDRNIAPYIVLINEPIRDALRKMDNNEEGLIVCVDESGILMGVLTDGDFRRWVMDNVNPDLDCQVGEIINREIASARIEASANRISSQLNQQVHFLPLTDNEGRCVGLARRRHAQLSIENHKIGAGQACFVIAEIGNNHNGSLELAYKLIDKAAEAGADCAKFQMRDLGTLYSNRGNPDDVKEDLGSQYTLDLLSRFQLSQDDMLRAFDYCHKAGVTPLCTPWDHVSVKKLEEYGISAYKTASADLTNHDLLQDIARLGKPIVCSTGMSTEAEIVESISLLESFGAQFALLHCNSTYPAPFKDLNLNYMSVLRKLSNCPVGYSSHDRGINIAVAAVALGANIIEKHFTLDRSMEGNDHRISLLPDELADMITGIRQVSDAIGSGGSKRLSQGELMNRESLGKSLYINTDLGKGEVIESHMIYIRSPGQGLQPNRKGEIVGKPAVRELNAGDILFPSDFGESASSAREFRYQRPFGIPVRHHDLKQLASLSNFDLLEFHLSYQDMKEEESLYFDQVRDMDLVIHAPELFESDHILDLCAQDEMYRSESIDHLQRVVDITRRMQKWFSRAEKPRIIVNAGGFTQDKPLEKSERNSYYQMILDSLDQMDHDGVEIIPQTMPPFPWHFGGQRYQNLFIDPGEIVDFCKQNDYRICLDTSHSKLACNYYHWSFSEFVRHVAPYTAHLHIVDAAGVDGEGLQINEGEIDFPVLAKNLDDLAPSVSFIPEIWQGHKNGGEGFWRALGRLEKYF